MPSTAVSSTQRMEFADVRVGPTEAVLEGPMFGSQFRGGPAWPDFKHQVLARHCRGPEPRPVDDPPLGRGAETKTLNQAVWCGPIVRHFGHMVADFGMRLPVSAHLEPGLRLLFSGGPGRAPPPHFYQMLDHLRIARERVRIVNRPVRVTSLVVYPQAERRRGGGPSEAHLDLMDALAPVVRPWSQKDIDTLYVSRSASVVGGLAGEGYFESVLAELGVQIFHPQTVTVREQLETYGRARRLVFCEGSAIHGLQLVGRLDAEVVVIARRPGTSIAKASLTPRCRSLAYVDALAAQVFGLRPSGWPQTPRGMGVLNEKRFLERMDEVGLRLRPLWSSADYRRRRDHDLAQWRAGREQLARRSPLEPLLLDHLIRWARSRDG